MADPSHHPRSPLLHLLDAGYSLLLRLTPSPNLLHHLFSGQPGILDILQRLKDKRPLSTNKAGLCTLPEWELKMFTCGCSLREKVMCRTGISISTLMSGWGHHCSICSRPTEKWPNPQHFCYLKSVWQRRISTSCLWNKFKPSMTGLSHSHRILRGTCHDSTIKVDFKKYAALKGMMERWTTICRSRVGPVPCNDTDLTNASITVQYSTSVRSLEEEFATPKGLLVSSHLSLSSITPFSSSSHLPHRLAQSLLHLIPPHCSLEGKRSFEAPKQLKWWKNRPFCEGLSHDKCAMKLRATWVIATWTNPIPTSCFSYCFPLCPCHFELYLNYSFT